MSLDVSLKRTVYLSYDKGKTYTEKDEEIYSSNITHNLGEMAQKANLYKALWRPEEIGAEKAKDIIDIVEKGLKDLKERPDYFKQFNSPNGWGLYKNFLPFVSNYLKALKESPEAIIDVCR